MMTRPADDAGGMIDGSQKVEACLSRWCNPKFGWFTEVYRVNFGWVVEYVGMGRFTHQRMPKKNTDKYTHTHIYVYIYIYIIYILYIYNIFFIFFIYLNIYIYIIYIYILYIFVFIYIYIYIFI